MEENQNDQTPEFEESLKHRVGKLAIGTIAGFIATTLAERAYDYAVEFYQNRKNTEE